MTLRLGDRSFDCQPGETVLEAFERHGIPLASSCRTGTCQTCLLHAVEGPVPAAAQAGLKPAWKQLGYLLACVCRPESDLVLATPGEGMEIEAHLLRRDWLDERVVRLVVQPHAELSFRAGQFVHLIRPDGLTRPYSIASLPGEEGIELHVRVLPDGRMSSWLARDLAEGGALRLRGPAGDCFYAEGAPEQPLLLVGVGTGIAPMWALARDALAQGHRAPIRIVHAAFSGRSLYLMPSLRELAARHPAVELHAVALSADGVDGVHEGDLRKVLPAIVPEPAGMRVYLCGDAELVNALRKQLFLAGASLRHLHADAFVGAAR